MRNVSHRHRNLVRGAVCGVMEPLGSGVFPEKVQHWGGLCEFRVSPYFQFLSLLYWCGWRCDLSAFWPVCLLPHCFYNWRLCLESLANITFPFIVIALVTLFNHSCKKVTNTPWFFLIIFLSDLSYYINVYIYAGCIHFYADMYVCVYGCLSVPVQ